MADLDINCSAWFINVRLITESILCIMASMQHLCGNVDHNEIVYSSFFFLTN